MSPGLKLRGMVAAKPAGAVDKAVKYLGKCCGKLVQSLGIKLWINGDKVALFVATLWVLKTRAQREHSESSQ
jgi:hypothetical protein